MSAERTITVRLSEAERAALDDLASKVGLSRSVLLRAGLRAVLADPGLVVGTPRDDQAGPAEREAAPPPSRGPNGRRRRRKR